MRKIKTHRFNKEDFREIESFKFKDCYVAYGRRSTADLDSQKNSLRFQRQEMLAYAEKQGLPLAPVSISGYLRDGVVSEKHSAFKENSALVISDQGIVQYGIQRPKFSLLVQHLSKGYFKGVIFLCWDRGARNDRDDNVIKALRKQGVDIRWVQVTYADSSSGELHMDIDGAFSKHYSRVTAERVKSTAEKCRKEGLCTYLAPVGFLNTGSMADKPHDPERAPMIARMFELACDDWSCEDITQWSIRHGFTMRPAHRKRTREEIDRDDELDEPEPTEVVEYLPSKQSIHKILRNRFYAGLIPDGHGGWIKSASHKPLVSMELFQAVQEKLTKKNSSRRYTEKLNHPYRGMVICAHCRRVYSPYTKKGILYLSCRCKAGCPNRLGNINAKFLETHIDEELWNIRFNAVAGLDVMVSASPSLQASRDAGEKRKADNRRRQKALRDELKYLSENKLSLVTSGLYTPEALMKEERRIQQLLDEVSASETRQPHTLREIAVMLTTFLELVESLEKQWKSAKHDERSKLARTIFLELSVCENRLQTKAIPGIEALKRPFVPSGAREDSLPELLEHSHDLSDAVETIERLTAKGVRKHSDEARMALAK